MAWAAALGGIFGSGSEGMASVAQYQASKHERNIAWKRQQQWELMAPSLRVQGLRAAGLNPVLAATQGMSHGPGNVQTASTGGSPSFDKDSVSKAISSAKQAKFMDEQYRSLVLANRQMHLKNLQEEEATRRSVWNTEWVRKYGEGLMRAETMAAQEQVLNLVAERGLFSARTAETDAMRMRIGVDRALMEMGMPGARAIEEMYQRYPLLRQLKEFGFNPVTAAGALGAGAGIAGGALWKRAGRAAAGKSRLYMPESDRKGSVLYKPRERSWE